MGTPAFTTHATGRSGPVHGSARRGDDEDKSTHTVVHVRPFNLFALQCGGAAVVWLEIAANFFERAVAEWVRWWSISHEPPPATFGALSGPKRRNDVGERCVNTAILGVREEDWRKHPRGTCFKTEGSEAALYRRRALG